MEPHFSSTSDSVEQTSVSHPAARYINFNATKDPRLGSRTRKLVPVRTAELIKFLEDYSPVATKDTTPTDAKHKVEHTSDSSEDEANKNILDTTVTGPDGPEPVRTEPLMPGVSWLAQTPAHRSAEDTRSTALTPAASAFNKLSLHGPGGAHPNHVLRNPGVRNSETVRGTENSLQTPAGQRIQYSMRSTSVARSGAKLLGSVARRRRPDHCAAAPNVQASVNTPQCGDWLHLRSAGTVLREKNVNVLTVDQQQNGSGGRVQQAKATGQEGGQFSMAGTSVCATFQAVHVRRQAYIVLSKLGEGGSCQVYDCLEQDTLRPRAIKVVSLAVDPLTATGYINEVKLLRDLQGNDRVIKMFAYEQVQQTLFVVMERGDVDFAVFLRTITTEPQLPTHIILCYWIEMLKCVNEIHNNGIIHSDLKPSNFLIVAGRLKLIDFGIASRLSADMTSVVKSVCGGTFNYISPEALLDSRDASSPAADGRPRIRISYKSDVWSLGCILYQMIYRRTPFHGYGNPMAKVTVISDRNHCIEYPRAEGVSPRLIDVMKACLVYDMKRRPTVQELLAANTTDLEC